MKIELFSFANRFPRFIIMNKVLILLLILLSTQAMLGQIVSADYKTHILIADSLYQQKNYKNAGSVYSVAFKVNGNKGLVNDRYHAACCYAVAGNTDSAFYNLFRIAEKAGWNKYELLISDTNFNSLHMDARWNKLVNKVRSNKAITDADEIK